MGTFKAKFRVWNPAHPENVEESEAFVDTGAAFSWIARSRLQRLGVTAKRRMPFPTIEGRVVERELAEVYVASDSYSAPDVVVMAEAGEMEVLGAHSLGAHSIEGLGLAADPVQKKLVPTILLALSASGLRRGRVVTAVDAALAPKKLLGPFSNEDFRRACPGFGGGTYQAFLWKHRRGNGHTSELFELVAPDQFKRIHT